MRVQVPRGWRMEAKKNLIVGAKRGGVWASRRFEGGRLSVGAKRVGMWGPRGFGCGRQRFGVLTLMAWSGDAKGLEY